MRSAWLAWRTIRRYRARTVLALIGVAVIGALLFDMLLLSHGLVDSFADLLGRTGYDIRVLNNEGLSLARRPIPDAARLAAAIERLPEVASVARVRIERGVVLHDGQASVNVTLIGSTRTGARVAWSLMKGSDLPSAPTPGCPVLLGRNLATRLGLEPGATLRLRAAIAGQQSALPTVDCPVIGVADSLFSAADEYDVLTTMEGLASIRGESNTDAADLILASSRADVGSAAAVRAIQRLEPELHVYSNEDVVAQFNQNGFTYFRQISVVLSSITVVFTFLLVATILTVSTNQRLGEIAALRALGISRPRIATALLWESVLIVGGGGILALPLGGAVAVVLDRILKQMPTVPEALHFFVFEPSAVVIHLLLLALTALVAALYPIWLTSRLPIAATLRREVVG